MSNLPCRAGTAATLAVCAVGFLVGACSRHEQTTSRDGDRLEAVPVAADSLTVSGASTGGYMAVQFHVAHSTLVRGAGVFAAGPYYCAEGSLTDALGRCMKGDADIPADQLATLTSELALDGEIDPIAGLADDRAFLFHGGVDPVVSKTVVDALQSYYATLLAPQAIERVDLAGAGHTFPTDDAALTACEVTEPPFVGACGYAGARRMLEHLYGAFAPAAGTPRPGELRPVNQAPYAAEAGASGLGARGWLYVPAACTGTGRPGRCRLHVVFHGCRQGASYVDDLFVRRSGYLAAADAGNVVLLFPQVEPSFQPFNPNGCWDWWGYGSEAYATRRGPQIMAVKAMIDDLLGAAAGESRRE